MPVEYSTAGAPHSKFNGLQYNSVIWVLSVLWLGLMLYGGINSDAEGQLALNLIFGGLPSAIGLTATYIATGTFFWPRDQQDN